MSEKFKLTYATMYNPPEELHEKFDQAIAITKKNLGKEYSMLIGGKEVFADEKFEDRTPINTELVLAVMQKGGEHAAREALKAAKKAFPGWSSLGWMERVKLLRKAADLIDERIFSLGAAMALEVGKNRMEFLATLLKQPISSVMPAIKWKRMKDTLSKWGKTL